MCKKTPKIVIQVMGSVKNNGLSQTKIDLQLSAFWDVKQSSLVGQHFRLTTASGYPEDGGDRFPPKYW
jgi:hypothetical protein